MGRRNTAGRKPVEKMEEAIEQEDINEEATGSEFKKVSSFKLFDNVGEFTLLDLKTDFSEYYFYKSEEEIWENAVICLDTNVLLDLYKMPEETRNFYFEVLEQIKNRIVIPYQVMDEFFRNRYNVIQKEGFKYVNICKELEKSLNGTNTYYDTEFRNKVPLIDELLDEIKKSVKTACDKIKEFQKKQMINYDNDKVFKRITELFQNSIHSPFSKGDLKKIYENGEKRFAKKCPPGFSDKNKPEEKRYGDYIIWEEMMMISRQKKLPIIFISNDEKQDWRRGKKNLLPRHELIEEFKMKTEQQFYMYNLEKFPENVKKYLKPNMKLFKDEINENYLSDDRFNWQSLDPVEVKKSGERLYLDYRRLSDSAIRILSENNRDIENYLFSDMTVLNREAHEILDEINFKISNNFFDRKMLEDLMGKYESLIEMMKTKTELNYVLRNAILQNIGILNTYCVMIGMPPKAISLD